MGGLTARRRSLPLLAFVSSFAVAGCGGDVPSPEGSVTAEAEPSALEGINFLAVASLGMPSGEPWEAFGGIWDVAAAPDGRFAVLDFEETAVHVYGPTGGRIGSIATQGFGLGELRRPNGIAWGGPGDLFVWDPGNSRVSRFSVSDAGVSYADLRRASAFGETGLCALGDRIYLSYLEGGNVVHEVNTQGAVVRSFSSPPPISGIEAIGEGLRELAVEDLSPSKLLCVEGRVLEVSFFQSRVQLHGADGNLLWSRELADFSPVIPHSPDDMGVGLQYAEGTGSHLARSAIPWGEGHVLIQHELRFPGPRPPGVDHQALESRLIRLDTGEEVARTRELPFFMAGAGRRAYHVTQHPYPQLFVLERE